MITRRPSRKRYLTWSISFEGVLAGLCGVTGEKDGCCKMFCNLKTLVKKKKLTSIKKFVGMGLRLMLTSIGAVRDASVTTGPWGVVVAEFG